MVEMDLSTLYDAINNFITVILGAVYSFIDSDATGGVLITLWNTIFSDSDIIKVAFLLAFLGGVYLYFKPKANGQRIF